MTFYKTILSVCRWGGKAFGEVESGQLVLQEAIDELKALAISIDELYLKDLLDDKDNDT